MMVMMVIMMVMMMMIMMAGDLYRDELQGPLLRAEHARAHRAARLQQGISYFYKLTFTVTKDEIGLALRSILVLLISEISKTCLIEEEDVQPKFEGSGNL